MVTKEYSGEYLIPFKKGDKVVVFLSSASSCYTYLGSVIKISELGVKVQWNNFNEPNYQWWHPKQIELFSKEKHYWIKE